MTLAEPPGLDLAPTLGDRASRWARILRRRWPYGLAVLVVVVLAAGGLVSRRGATYTATAKLLVTPDTQVAGLIGGPTGAAPSDLEREADTALTLVKLDSTARSVKRALGLHLPTTDLLAEVSAAYDGNSNVVALTVTDASPVRAAAIANGFARAYEKAARSDIVGKLATAETGARSQLAHMTPAERRSELGRSLKSTIVRLRTASVLQVGSAGTVQVATPPTASSGVSLKMLLVVALLMGLSLGAVAMALVDRVDPRLHTDDDMAGAFGVSWVTRMPTVRRLRKDPRAAADGLDRLAGKLMFTVPSPRGGAGPVVLVGEPHRSEAGRRVAFGLTTAIARLRKRVITIAAQPGESAPDRERRDAPDDLASVLTGRANLDDGVAIPWGKSSPGELSEAEPLVLHAGSVTGPSLAALLASPRLGDLLRDARESADLVLVQSPALLDGSDAFPLLRSCDAVLLVATAGVTTRSDAAEIVQLLQDLGRPILGVVVMGRPSRRGPSLRAREAAGALARRRIPLGTALDACRAAQPSK